MPQRVQEYFLKAPIGPSPVIALLEGEKEIVGQGEHLLALCHFLLMPTDAAIHLAHSFYLD
jgi:hypothetical protein